MTCKNDRGNTNAESGSAARLAMARGAGFTIVELLIAAAIFVVILVALVALFVNSSQAYTVNERISERQQDAQTVRALIQNEVSLAGYRGVCQDATANPFGGSPTIEVQRDTPTAGSDTIRVRYVDDRFGSGGGGCGPVRAVAFSIGEDDQGRDSLMVDYDGGGPSPAVANVSGLRLIGYVTGDGGEAANRPASFIAVRFEIEFSDGRVGRFVVGLRNQQSNASDS